MSGKVKVERRQRLLDICKHVVDNPHDVDGDTKAALKRATLKYASTLHDDPTQALEVLYHDQNEIGRLLRKAVEVIADHDDDRESGDGGGGGGGGARKQFHSRLADLAVESGKFLSLGKA